MAKIEIVYAGSIESIIEGQLTLNDVKTHVLARIPDVMKIYIKGEPGIVKIIVFDLEGPCQIEFDRVGTS